MTIKQARRSNTKAGDRVLYVGDRLDRFYPVTIHEIPEEAGKYWQVLASNDGGQFSAQPSLLYKCSDSEMDECLALFKRFKAACNEFKEADWRHRNAKAADLFEDAKGKAQEALKLAEAEFRRVFADEENAKTMARLVETTTAFCGLCDEAGARSQNQADAKMAHARATKDEAERAYQAFAERVCAPMKRKLFAPY